MLEFFAIIITISAVFGYINHKWLKLPTTIGVMLISVVLGIALKIIETINPTYISPLRDFLTGFDFSAFVLDFILCFLLFAGALHVKNRTTKRSKSNRFFLCNFRRINFYFINWVSNTHSYWLVWNAY
jgi:CPA1 family monovalent cation:H+ antiporter